MTFYQYRIRGKAGRPKGSRNKAGHKAGGSTHRDSQRLKILKAVWNLVQKYNSGQINI